MIIINRLTLIKHLGTDQDARTTGFVKHKEDTDVCSKSELKFYLYFETIHSKTHKTKDRYLYFCNIQTFWPSCDSLQIYISIFQTLE